MVGYDCIKHDSHPGHNLKLEREKTPYVCNGCRVLGIHSRYTCVEESCNFHLHPDCAHPRPSLYHPFFKGCSFRFMMSGESGRRCDACGEDVMGFVYHCDKCGKDLHPCCANLRDIEDGQLKLVLKNKMPSKCGKCKMTKMDHTISTWGYVSTCKTYCFHIPCVHELFRENWMKRPEPLGHGDEGSSEGLGEIAGGGDGDGRELVKKTPLLQLAVGKSKGTTASGKFARAKKMVKIVITFIIAALLGDPTAMAAGLIASLISH